MRVYKTNQTGPKTEFGGKKDGLISVEYQVGIAWVVNTAPKIPVS